MQRTRDPRNAGPWEKNTAATVLAARTADSQNSHSGEFFAQCRETDPRARTQPSPDDRTGHHPFLT